MNGPNKVYVVTHGETGPCSGNVVGVAPTEREAAAVALAQPYHFGPWSVAPVPHWAKGGVRYYESGCDFVLVERWEVHDAGKTPADSYCITLPNGSVWAVPVMAIAKNRARHYADEFGGDVGRSLMEDTLPLFRGSPAEIEDWAANNMNWADVQKHAVQVEAAPEPDDDDFQEAWVNGEHTLRGGGSDG